MVKPLVLIVDDDAAIRELCQDFLEEEGYATLCAANGQDAIALATRHQPAAILMDEKMPELDGVATCRWLKQHAVTHHIPIILMSAAELSQVADAQARAAADGFLLKPFDLEDLLTLLATVVPAPEGRA